MTETVGLFSSLALSFGSSVRSSTTLCSTTPPAMTLHPQCKHLGFLPNARCRMSTTLPHSLHLRLHPFLKLRSTPAVDNTHMALRQDAFVDVMQGSTHATGYVVVFHPLRRRKVLLRSVPDAAIANWISVTIPVHVGS